MKYSYWLIPVFLLLYSCHKNSPAATPFSYFVTKLPDDTIMQGGRAGVTLLVSLLNGLPDSVTLKFSGLPANISVNPGSSSYLASYSQDFLFFATDSAALGVHPITVIASSLSLPDQVSTFNMTVMPTDCSVNLVDTAIAHDTCNIGNYIYTVAITEGDSLYQVSITNLAGSASSVFADVNCPAATLTIPQQYISSNLSFAGTGTFTANKIVINYSTYNTSGPTVTCMMTINR